jgi:hypothetical protein
MISQSGAYSKVVNPAPPCAGGKNKFQSPLALAAGSALGTGGESGIRTHGRPLDSVSYRRHIAGNARNAGDAVDPCTPLQLELSCLRPGVVSANKRAEVEGGGLLRLPGSQNGAGIFEISARFSLGTWLSLGGG